MDVDIDRDIFFPLTNLSSVKIPDKFSLYRGGESEKLCEIAVKSLQTYISDQQWDHNFGLSDRIDVRVIGKMFGVLVVQTKQGTIGYLSAFSGKLAGSNHHNGFVPPVFDSLAQDSFLNEGMAELSKISLEITKRSFDQGSNYNQQIETLKSKRRDHSIALQYRLFNSYKFLSRTGKEKTLNELFKNASYKNPPAGAGECAGIKLLQYAFMNKMKPLAMTEFWWGLSPKSEKWQHGQFYPCCLEKCEPILAHMLRDIDHDLDV